MYVWWRVPRNEREQVMVGAFSGMHSWGRSSRWVTRLRLMCLHFRQGCCALFFNWGVYVVVPSLPVYVMCRCHVCVVAHITFVVFISVPMQCL